MPHARLRFTHRDRDPTSDRKFGLEYVPEIAATVEQRYPCKQHVYDFFTEIRKEKIYDNDGSFSGNGRL
jgi:hypothetical protein